MHNVVSAFQDSGRRMAVMVRFALMCDKRDGKGSGEGKSKWK